MSSNALSIKSLKEIRRNFRPVKMIEVFQRIKNWMSKFNTLLRRSVPCRIRKNQNGKKYTRSLRSLRTCSVEKSETAIHHNIPLVKQYSPVPNGRGVSGSFSKISPPISLYYDPPTLLATILLKLPLLLFYQDLPLYDFIR